jgi:hypothetical protein
MLLIGIGDGKLLRLVLLLLLLGVISRHRVKETSLSSELV